MAQNAIHRFDSDQRAALSGRREAITAGSPAGNRSCDLGEKYDQMRETGLEPARGYLH